MEQKPLVVVNGLVRKDAIAYLKEHVEVRQWTEKTVMPRETLKEWLVDADGLWCVRPLDVDGDLVKNAPNLKVIAQAAVGYFEPSYPWYYWYGCYRGIYFSPCSCLWYDRCIS